MPKPLAKLGAGYDLSFSPDGRFLATMPSSAPAKLYRTSDWCPVAAFSGLKDPRRITFIRDSRVAVVASIHKDIGVFSVPDGALIRKWRTPLWEFGALAVTPDHQQIVISDQNKLLFYSLDTGKKTDELPVGDQPIHADPDVRAAIFSRRGKHLCVLWTFLDLDGCWTRITVRAWPSRRILRSFEVAAGARSRPMRIGARADSIYLSHGGNGVFGARDVAEYSLAKGACIRRLQLDLPNETRQFGFSFSPCGKRLLVTHDDVVLIRTADGSTPLGELKLSGTDRILDAQLSPDLKYLAVGTGAVSVWKTEDLLSSRT